MIPRIVHRVWLGGDVPRDARRFGESWERHCPGWEVRTWRDWDLPPLINQDAFDAAAIPRRRPTSPGWSCYCASAASTSTPTSRRSSRSSHLLDGVDCFARREDRQVRRDGNHGIDPGHPFIAPLVERVAGLDRCASRRTTEPADGAVFVTPSCRLPTLDEPPRVIAVVVFPPESVLPVPLLGARAAPRRLPRCHRGPPLGGELGRVRPQGADEIRARRSRPVPTRAVGPRLTAGRRDARRSPGSTGTAAGPSHRLGVVLDVPLRIEQLAGSVSELPADQDVVHEGTLSGLRSTSG